ncbi:restriction endonuclease subunit S [Xanthomonas euvesicatoria]|uniref:restriction endonuclease subunit S n=1 Tax=Xanthomonas euvesicatoria TaxID=456327 RepID=UPI0024062D40|nr:restriction endonuclease subunit S [Xanthomonas euvesicatoria]MCC8913936.1 restriction endonuclease subunit S [Xanthomonas euvesicatoria]
MGKQGVKTVVPRLRFPEFRKMASWPIVPLERIAARISTKNCNGQVTRVLTNSAEFGVLDQRDYFDKDIATAGKVDGYYVVSRGDYVYNPRTSAIAPVGPISRNNLGEGVMSPLYTVFRFFEEKTDFYEHYFKSSGWHSYLRSAASTGARHDRMSITAGTFVRMPVPSPSREEQQKIADCLTSFDEVISAQGRKVEALKTHKRGLMQQLFPLEGEALPRLRFPEFRDAPEWESKRLDSVAPLQRGFDLPSGELKYGTVPVVYSNGVRGYHKVGMARGPGLVTGRSGTIGNMHYIDGGDYWPHNTSLWVTTFKGHEPKFVYFLYAAIGLERFASGSGVPTLNRNDVHTFETRVPGSVAEQKRIADCLTSLDTQIIAESAQLTALKTHKQGLMQQLFPAQRAG